MAPGLWYGEVHPVCGQIDGPNKGNLDFQKIENSDSMVYIRSEESECELLSCTSWCYHGYSFARCVRMFVHLSVLYQDCCMESGR